MPKFRRRPLEVEAVQLTWPNWSEMCDFAGVGRLEDGKPTGTNKDLGGDVFTDGGPGLWIPSREGLLLASPGDWIVKGLHGKLHPCNPDIFEEIYEPVDES